MSFWLLKSEPSVYSISDMKRDKTTHWDGVRNYQAANYMKAMKNGDSCFFYHSNEDRAIVGTVKIVKEYYPDKKDETGKFGIVDIKFDKIFKNPVTLADIKANAKLAELPLIRQSRLSVMPIEEKYWKIITAMADLKT